MTEATDKKKSIVLTAEQRRDFAKWVKKHTTKKEAAEALGVMPFTIDRILMTGRCSPDTIEKIETALAA
jgi:IS30 family transposase